MNLTMQIRRQPQRIDFEINAWYVVSPPVQYLGPLLLSDLDPFDVDILIFESVLPKGRMLLSDIVTDDDLIYALKPTQLCVPVYTTIEIPRIMNGVVPHDDALQLYMPICRAVNIKEIVRDG